MKIQWQAIIVSIGLMLLAAVGWLRLAAVVIHIYGDEEVEGDEQFTLRLFDPQGVILDTSSATGTIVNDDEDDDYHIFLPIIIR
jgi:hypothetical protein